VPWQGNFQYNTYMDDVSLQVRFKRLQQLYPDQHQQQVSKNFE